MKLIDGLILRSFYKAWCICFFSLVSLYIVIDLFNRLDDLASAGDGTALTLLSLIGQHYGHQLVLIFDRLCGTIVMLAATFTVTWMQRTNEILPLLAAGVPMRRILRPVFIGTVSMVLLSVANREFLMPHIAEQLQNPPSDPRGEKVRQAGSAYEPNGILISATLGEKKGMLTTGFSCTAPEKLAGSLVHITAGEARYVPRGPKQPSGGWLLTEATPGDLPHWSNPVIEVLEPGKPGMGKYFLHTERVDFEMLTRSRNWYQFASVFELFSELQKPDAARLSSLAIQMHLRFTLPLLTVIMVMMGLAVLLRDQNRNMFLNAGLCLILAGAFLGACHLSRHVGEQEYLSPALAAWLPVLGFGPASLAMFDAMHT
jgi:lipopolysaccharide export system permease protein